MSMTQATPATGTLARPIDGRARSEAWSQRIMEALPAFEAQSGRCPGLAAVLVGDDPASEVYVGAKLRMTEKMGLHSLRHVLPQDATQEGLMALIADLNADPTIDGILLQLPLPAHLDAGPVLRAIDPAKDVDGLHPLNAGLLAAGEPALISCTPLGCLMLLKDTLGDLSGRDAIMIGTSVMVGKPMVQLLLAEGATVTAAHKFTRDLPEKVRAAEIVIVATGRAGLVRGDWLRPGATVIDIGMTRTQVEGKTRLLGDVAYDEAVEVAGAITPVPGGVGPMTIMALMHNTVLAAYRREGMTPPAMG
ncbi:bifunctional methylenetetrahydrofolate dehydrogenase/methenyltetrahydrofolate cyclohydrolase FolD [Pseudoroseicyclus aestuarii]|uniref:Bifunctional protein FolD n=1 Tax=Pseudoroseicyclus aestuarii TaxID=1795041 RepID=A0A318SS89_9RHOB|nr:bifunctional methylenetetrahydrofolate dehydrogenase/methenyltetrahydrofolate cyclohydrolase FolD [Pseudoroseicyclus aestuarii]PYE81236.1 methenyltetrahydrofolate cyclohydrolase /5,10-methylenetetrahydrofolate dehydrogenase (NADP+) [Pseudoroseicyclus aestuarii]